MPNGGRPKPRLKARRNSQPIATTMKRGAKSAVNGAKRAGKGVGRWLGVTDDQQMQTMQTMYAQRKADQARGVKRRPQNGTRGFGATMAANRRKTYIELQNEESDTDEEAEDDYVQQLNAKEGKQFTRDMAKGMDAYRALRALEKQKQKKPGWFGGVENRRRDSVHQEDAYRTASFKKPERKHSKVKDQTMVALQLEALPEYYPWFTFSITALQILIMLGMLLHVYTYDPEGEGAGFAKWSLVAETKTCAKAEDVSCPLNFIGELNTSYEVEEEVNWTYGPDSQYLLQIGAKWSGCMRIEGEATQEAALIRNTKECIVRRDAAVGIGYNCEAEATGQTGMACCETFSANFVGMTTYDDCKSWFIKDIKNDNSIMASGTGTGSYFQSLNLSFPHEIDKDFVSLEDNRWWKEGTDCSDRDSMVRLRPCCGIRMDTENFCEIITESECTARKGAWQTDKLLCADTICQSSICQLREELSEKTAIFDVGGEGEFRNVPKKVNQWWRLIAPLFLHSGAIHCLLVLVVQYHCGKNIEAQAGLLRTVLIYFISGIGGNLISGIFSPRSVSLGADPAVYGLLAVMYVELFQAWQVVENAKFQFFKLTAMIVVSLLIGTLPYVDNWSHVGGLAFGFVSGIVFLPYITFGKWDARRKKMLLYFCIPFLILMFLLAILTFYVITDSAFCPVNKEGVNTCGYFNCIEWTNSIDCGKYY